MAFLGYLSKAGDKMAQQLPMCGWSVGKVNRRESLMALFTLKDTNIFIGTKLKHLLQNSTTAKLLH